MSERARNLARRASWRLVIAGVLGCATSVLLVWVLAFTRPGPEGKDYKSFVGTVDEIDVQVGVATLEHTWATGQYWKVTRYSSPIASYGADALSGVLPDKHLRSAVVRDALRQGAVSHGGEAWEYRWGWPRRCLVATWGSLDRVGNPPPWEWRGAIHFKTPVLSSWRGMDDVLLGYRPLPLGLVVNTATYGGAWFVLLVAAASARRALRRHRGRCPMCAYDLGGELQKGCPECGWGKDATEGPEEGVEGVSGARRGGVA